MNSHFLLTKGHRIVSALRLAHFSNHLKRTNHNMSLPSWAKTSSTADSSGNTKAYDAIVIGSGQGGGPLATAFAKSGKKTALVEAVHLGGCCVNEGCTPTKTMVASGRVAYLARRGKDYGVHTSEGDAQIKVDMTKVRQRKRDIVDQFRSGSERRAAAVEGLDVLMGTAKFLSEKNVQVSLQDGGAVDISGDVIVINTGERPVKPTLPGLESVDSSRVLDSTSVQELGEVPKHLLVLGGGYIGLEFGQLFRRLGAEVTIIQRGKQLLPREDPDIAKAMLEILEQDGITIHLSTTATGISGSDGDLPVTLKFKSSEGTEKEARGSHILFAAGRTPNTDMLNLDAAGVKMDSRGHIVATDDLRTTTPGIWVLGDVKGGPAFTHIAYDDFRILQNNLITHPNPPTAGKWTVEGRRGGKVPYVVYTDPQLGHVGLHESEARALQPPRNIKVAVMPMAYVARAMETDEKRGVMKGIVDGETGQILGFTCLGVEGGEIMTVVQMAMMGGLKYGDLQGAVFAHPTFAESLNNLWGSLK